jgi:hypothetical protein
MSFNDTSRSTWSCSHPDRCGASADNALRMRGRSAAGEAGTEAQTLIQSPSVVVLGSAHRCASLVGSAYDARPTGRACRPRALPQARRARPRRRSPGQRSGPAGPDTTALRVVGSLPLPLWQRPGNDSDQVKFRKPTGNRSGQRFWRALIALTDRSTRPRPSRRNDAHPVPGTARGSRFTAQ